MKFNLEGSCVELTRKGQMNRFKECRLSAFIMPNNNIQSVIEANVCLLEATVVLDDRSLDKHAAPRIFTRNLP